MRPHGQRSSPPQSSRDAGCPRERSAESSCVATSSAWSDDAAWSDSSLEDDTVALRAACARWWDPLAALDTLFRVEPGCDAATADVFIGAAHVLDGSMPATLNRAAQACLDRAHAAFDRLLASQAQLSIAQLQALAVFALLQRLRCCRLEPSYTDRLMTEIVRPRQSSWPQRVLASRLAVYLRAAPFSSTSLTSTELLRGGGGDHTATLVMRLLPTLIRPDPQLPFESKPMAILRAHVQTRGWL